MFYRVWMLLCIAAFSLLPFFHASAKPLVVGTSADYPPFEYYQSGKMIGLDVDLIHLLSTRMDQAVIIQDMDFNALIPALLSGKIDIAIGGMDPTPERAKIVDFTPTYYHSNAAILSKKSAPILTKEALQGKRIGVQLGSSFETIIAGWHSSIPNLTVVSRARIPQLVEELKTNHIDALLVSIPIAKRVVQSTTDLPLDVLALPEEGTEAAAIATAKDAPHTALLHTKLASLVQEGAVEALVDKWIASPDTTTTIAIDDQHSTTWYIIQGIRLTLQYTIIGLVGGFLLAIPLLFAKLSRHKALRALSIGYTSIFRGTPLLVQLCIVYYGLPNLTDVHLPAFVAASLTFSLNSAAYVSEILLGGVRAIDAGQEQAARALGLSRMQIMRHILLPQTFRNVAPSLMNEMIDLLKESSLVSIIGEADIMRRAQIVSAQNYNYMTPLLIAAACYYVLVILLSQGVKWTNYYLKRSI